MSRSTGSRPTGPPCRSCAATSGSSLKGDRVRRQERRLSFIAVRRALIVATLAAALAGAAPAAAGTGLRISLLGQTHKPLAGSPWAYYLRAWGPGGRPFQGAILLEVVTPTGKKIDGIGQFAFNGTWLKAYI